MNFFDKGEKYYFSSIEEIRREYILMENENNFFTYAHEQLTLRIVR
jgi:hypothetical protein